MIHAEKSSLIYRDGTQALKTFDLHIPKGELVYITGPSGSGKTSLLKLLMGIEFTTSGTLEVLGQPMLQHHEAAIRRMRTQVGPVFQDFRLLEGRSVLENVLLGMRFLDIKPHDRKVRAEESIHRVGLDHKRHHPISNLSWGECQRVSIARAVARTPLLIVADEPTGNLDKDNAVHILRLLESFRSPETTVVITTHATHLMTTGQPLLHLIMESGQMTAERRAGDV
jgi:cell division transport system ATP-binding protein